MFICDFEVIKGDWFGALWSTDTGVEGHGMAWG